METHRIRSGQQTITVTVPRKPTRAGIDPENLLIDLETENNIKRVKIENQEQLDPDLARGGRPGRSRLVTHAKQAAQWRVARKIVIGRPVFRNHRSGPTLTYHARLAE